MAETRKVSINNMAFNPANLTIKVGDTVEWTNQMAFDHTVTPDKGEFPSSGHIEPQDTYSHTFGATGSVAYHCEIHPRMKGTVIVTWSEFEVGNGRSIMASSWSITINQQNGQITFTPDVPGARAGQPLGVNTFDNVTWNNRTNQEITLRSIQPEGLFLCDPIPAGDVSNPIFNVTGSVASVGYYWVRQQAPPPAQPDAWIVVVPITA